MAYMTAVIYARYSSSNQREESIEGQIRECKAFAERNGYTVLRSYEDRALSGKTDKRPEFQQMIADSKRKLFDTIHSRYRNAAPAQIGAACFIYDIVDFIR